MKSPAFLFYPGDFITGTLFMSNESVGAYIRVLCMQHEKGHLTENEVKQICKNDEIFLSIISHFKKDKKGLFFNQRLDLEKEKRQKYSESRSKNRANPNQKKISYENHMKNISKSYEEHMENENENINNNIYINNIKSIDKEYIINLYINNINNNISSIELEKLEYYIDLFKEDLRIIEYGIEYCKMYKAYNINYLSSILNSWNKSGYKTLEDVKENEKQKKNKKNQIIIDYDWLSE